MTQPLDLSRNEPNGLPYVSCLFSADGRLVQQLYPQIRQADTPHSVQGLLETLQSLESETLNDLLASLQNEQTVFGIPVTDHYQHEAYLAGALINNQRLIVAAPDIKTLSQVFVQQYTRFLRDQNQVMQQNLDQVGQRRQSEMADDETLFHELILLNNQLINTQRELYKRAAQLQQARNQAESIKVRLEAELARQSSELENRIREQQEVESQLQFQAHILDKVQQAVLVTDTHAKVLYWNSFTERMFGWRADEAVGKNIQEFPLPLVDINQVTQIKHWLLDGKSWSGELLLNRREGTSRFPAQVTAAPIQDSDGKIIAFIAIAEDITNRVFIERALRHSEARYRQIFQGNHASILIIDPRTTAIVDANPAACHYYQYEHSKLTSMSLRELSEDPENCGLSESTIEQPLQSRHKKATGETRDVEIYAGPVEIDDIVFIYAIIHDISDRKRMEARLTRMALYDPLTQLPNRFFFEDELAGEIDQASQNNATFGVMILNLVRFSDINDIYGLAFGDSILQQVAKRLSKHLHPSDTLARMGSDEFAFIIRNSERYLELFSTGNQILNLLQQPFRLNDLEIYLDGRIGACLAPVDGDNLTVLLRNTKTALSAARNLGGSRVQLYESHLSILASERVEQLNRLRSALDQDRLRLAYQPEVDLRNGEINAIEALLRWPQDGTNPMSPSLMISLAEESGLIVRLGRWVLDETCRQILHWQKDGRDVPPVAINISAIQLSQTDFVQSVLNTLQAYEIEPQQIILEVTETVFLRDMESASAKLAILRRTGMQIYLDDFGAGYSSLSYLRNLPIDVLKIDRTFIKNIDTEQPGSDTSMLTVVRSICTLGHNLKRQVLAEGVETKEQLTMLKDAGCDIAQGYYLARPHAPNELWTTIADIPLRFTNPG